MQTQTYQKRRGQIAVYFDKTAVEAWTRLTSEQPVGRIRATVRAGRDRMRQTLLDWLPADLRGERILDAGCGTGALAMALASRGAHVVAVDISPTLISLARERMAPSSGAGDVEFAVGDMLDPDLGRFDRVIAMDSLIHYSPDDAIAALVGLAARADRSILFTFAPRTAPLAVMHAIGRLFPRTDRAPAIEPVAERQLRDALAAQPDLKAWSLARTERIVNGFYTSQAAQLVHRCDA
ncbi:MAG: magnesium protoporphyrin IX methyltransferase [Rhodospirillales bacterium]|jgi:magnesium-protoporphyrin O-methyltransferase|nr:magnesium protoporphyrin IX methyltransferase [Rhodospirillales bacterium]